MSHDHDKKSKSNWPVWQIAIFGTLFGLPAVLFATPNFSWAMWIGLEIYAILVWTNTINYLRGRPIVLRGFSATANDSDGKRILGVLFGYAGYFLFCGLSVYVSYRNH